MQAGCKATALPAAVGGEGLSARRGHSRTALNTIGARWQERGQQAVSIFPYCDCGWKSTPRHGWSGYDVITSRLQKDKTSAPVTHGLRADSGGETKHYLSLLILSTRNGGAAWRG